jgi:toxin CcdB
MARFDVYQNPDAEERKYVPYFLDIQNSYLEIGTRIVVPLHISAQFVHNVRNLNLELTVQGKQVVMNTSALGSIPVSDLRRPITNIAPQRGSVQNALDTLFGGY